jgi:hypothetical protein
MTEFGFGVDGMGMHVGMAPWQEAAREVGHFTVARWDNDMSDWASRKMGGEGTGQQGFVPPNDVMFHQLGIKPYSVTMSDPRTEHNLITTGGWNRALTLLIGGGGSTLASGSARIGVGTGTAAASINDVNLSAATSGATARFWNMVTGSGIIAAGTATQRLSFTATFGTGDANFSWQEWAIDQGTVGSGTGAPTLVLFNHAISNQGSKVSGNTWTATCNLDFT